MNKLQMAEQVLLILAFGMTLMSMIWRYNAL